MYNKHQNTWREHKTLLVNYKLPEILTYTRYYHQKSKYIVRLKKHATNIDLVLRIVMLQTRSLYFSRTEVNSNLVSKYRGHFDQYIHASENT